MLHSHSLCNDFLSLFSPISTCMMLIWHYNLWHFFSANIEMLFFFLLLSEWRKCSRRNSVFFFVLPLFVECFLRLLVSQNKIKKKRENLLMFLYSYFCVEIEKKALHSRSLIYAIWVRNNFFARNKNEI